MSWTSRARYARHRSEEMASETLEQAHESPSADPSLAEEARWFRNVTEKLAVIQLVSAADDSETGIRARPSKTLACRLRLRLPVAS